MPVEESSAGSRTSIKMMGFWVGLLGVLLGREAVIYSFCLLVWVRGWGLWWQVGTYVFEAPLAEGGSVVVLGAFLADGWGGDQGVVVRASDGVDGSGPFGDGDGVGEEGGGSGCEGPGGGDDGAGGEGAGEVGGWLGGGGEEGRGCPAEGEERGHCCCWL